LGSQVIGNELQFFFLLFEFMLGNLGFGF